jgi:hypothetical protein
VQGNDPRCARFPGPGDGPSGDEGSIGDPAMTGFPDPVGTSNRQESAYGTGARLHRTSGHSS